MNHHSSDANGDQTERLASPSPRRRSTSGGDEAAAMEPGTRFQESDFSEQPGTNASQDPSRQRFLARSSVGTMPEDRAQP